MSVIDIFYIYILYCTTADQPSGSDSWIHIQSYSLLFQNSFWIFQAVFPVHLRCLQIYFLFSILTYLQVYIVLLFFSLFTNAWIFRFSGKLLDIWIIQFLIEKIYLWSDIDKFSSFGKDIRPSWHLNSQSRFLWFHLFLINVGVPSYWWIFINILLNCCMLIDFKFSNDMHIFKHWRWPRSQTGWYPVSVRCIFILKRYKFVNHGFWFFFQNIEKQGNTCFRFIWKRHG